MKALYDILKKIGNLNGSLIYCTYHWPDGVKELSGNSNIQKVWEEYKWVIHNTYHGGYIETNYQVIQSMSEDVANKFVLFKFTVPESGTLREVIENDTTTIYKIPLNGLKVTKFQSISASMMNKNGMEVAESCTILNYGPPISQNK